MHLEEEDVISVGTTLADTQKMRVKMRAGGGRLWPPPAIRHDNRGIIYNPQPVGRVSLKTKAYRHDIVLYGQ